MRTHEDSGKWNHIFRRKVEKPDSPESTFHAFKDTVAFIINITVVIPSDATIGRAMNSPEAKGESFDGLHSV